MPKTVQLQIAVPGCTAQAFFDAVYGGSTCLLQFHREVNKCETPSATELVDGHRSVTFTTPVDAPAFLRRLIGTDAVPVVESQAVSRDASGAIVVRSDPVPQFPGADKFRTLGITTIRDTAGGCQARKREGERRGWIDAVVECSASGPYGLTGTIEGFMAATALKSMQEFWGFCQAYVARLIASGQLEAVEPVEPAAPAVAAAEPAAAAVLLEPAGELEGEAFYDAQDALAGDLARLPEPPAGVRFEEAALLYLRYLCRTGDQQVAVLQAVEKRLVRLEQAAADATTAAAEQRQCGAGAAAWLLRWQWPDMLSTRQALLLAGLASTSSALLVLRWERQHSRG
eukprot:scaffold1.g5320.t1